VGKGIQKGSQGHEGNQRALRAGHPHASPGRPGRKPKKAEPGLANDADLIRIAGALWPDFNRYLDSVGDCRRKDRVVYKARLILFLAILQRIMGHASNRQHDQVKHEPAFADTIRKLTKSYPEFLPHSDTIKYLVERLKPEDLEAVRRKMVNRLLRSKRLAGMRTGAWLDRRRRYYLVAIDGVHYHSSCAPIGHSTHKTHSGGRTEYMLTALEASLVSPSGIRIPLMTQFIENPDGEYDKQDCELKAAKRLMNRLKAKFGRLRLVILLDGLHLCEDILKICRQNQWQLSVTVNEKTSAFLREAEEALDGEAGRHFTGTDPKDGRTRRVFWRNGLKHQFGSTEFTLNVIRMTKGNGDKEDCHVYATTIFLHNKDEEAVRVLDEICRARWQIEEQFKGQKHHGLELEAAFGTRGCAGQNFYLIVQIADIIRTFMIHSSLFRRLQQMAHSKEITEVIQRPMLEWYETISNFVDRFRRAVLGCKLSEINMDGWRLSLDTA